MNELHKKSIPMYNKYTLKIYQFALKNLLILLFMFEKLFISK